MSDIQRNVVDGNGAAASVAYRLNEVIAIYPITPASPMGELADEWSAAGRRNVWGDVPDVVEMQSEGGAAGAVHGALQAGALATTFTASQGLLLMLPNMYKIAGELTSHCMHVAARTVATHALSIFGDHSDVMACRQSGFAMLASGSVQEAHDFACIGHAATLLSRVPVLHFFDGFRTSHEISRIHELSDDDLRALIDDEAIARHRERALTPDRPVIRGTAQNPDAFFQAREASNPFHDACPGIVQDAMSRFAERTGRRYGLFDYTGHPEAERVIVLMGSGAETAHETVEHLAASGEPVGLLRVRLYRPFSARDFVAALPGSVRALAVLDRTKEPGAPGEPLYQDVVSALHEARQEGDAARAPSVVVGGRYGLSSKEFDPTMVGAVLDELRENVPRNHFTVGIVDDVTHRSLAPRRELSVEDPETRRAVFFGLGSDGTVGANKASIEIIAEEADACVQAYFVYDSRKSGAVTVSHLRYGPRPIRSTHLVRRASFVACHQFHLLDRLDVLQHAAEGADVLLNAPMAPERVWEGLPREVQETVVEKGLRLHAIDAHGIARRHGLGGRINRILQACFFAITDVVPTKRALERIDASIQRAYGKKGPELVQRNQAAVAEALDALHAVQTGEATAQRTRPLPVPEEAPDFVRRVTGALLAGHGDALPVSAFPVDGTWPVGTSRWEKRNLAHEIPAWEPDLCIQCNKCALACPHAAIRAKVVEPAALAGAPESFVTIPWKGTELAGHAYALQVAPEDCTGCRLCIEVCPAKDKSNPRRKALGAVPREERVDTERESYAFFRSLPEVDRSMVKLDNKGSQLLEPLFEASGACAGCGETPYLKLLTQLFGDRLLVANATGCSSIFGGNLPTTPWSANADGRGPAWSNSLFEDNAEFGFGFRLAVDELSAQARRLLRSVSSLVGDQLVDALLADVPHDEEAIAAQRQRVSALRAKLQGSTDPDAVRLLQIADYLVPKSTWLVGGDGWAYDIGYGGLDHVLAQRRDVNVLVLDTEAYSNTGGQQSKATPLGAAAKFAIAGKDVPKKDLGLEAMSYGHVYVARVAFGAKDQQTVRALLEANAHPGPSIVIAYAHCIAHGYDLSAGARQQQRAVQSGTWPLYRFDPSRVKEGKPPLVLDSGEPTISVEKYAREEGRYRLVELRDPERHRRLMAAAQEDAERRWSVYRQLATVTMHRDEKE